MRVRWTFQLEIRSGQPAQPLGVECRGSTRYTAEARLADDAAVECVAGKIVTGQRVVSHVATSDAVVSDLPTADPESGVRRPTEGDEQGQRGRHVGVGEVVAQPFQHAGLLRFLSAGANSVGLGKLRTGGLTVAPGRERSPGERARSRTDSPPPGAAAPGSGSEPCRAFE